MRVSPFLVVAALATAIVGGVVSGESIGATGMVKRGTQIDVASRSAPIEFRAHAAPHRQLPDHYTLETPEGRVEVGELALRGRLRDSHAGMRWEYEQDAAAADQRAYTLADLGEARRAAVMREETLVAYTAQRESMEPIGPAPRYEREPAPAQAKRLTRAEAPLALADPVTVAPVAQPAVQRVGNAKSIDIVASLAAQR